MMSQNHEERFFMIYVEYLHSTWGIYHKSFYLTSNAIELEPTDLRLQQNLHFAAAKIR